MRSGAISDTIGMLPAIKITEPYSPIPRAKASANPVRSAWPFGLYWKFEIGLGEITVALYSAFRSMTATGSSARIESVGTQK